MILVGAAAAGGGCRVRPNHPLFAGLSELACIEAPQPIGTPFAQAVAVGPGRYQHSARPGVRVPLPAARRPRGVQ